MSMADRMTAHCASMRMVADLTRDYEAYEVFEDMRNLFGHAAEALENEPDSTVRPFMEGMARALARARVIHRPRFSGRMNGSAKGIALGEESRSPKNDELEQSGHEHGARHGPDERLQPRRA